MSIKIINVPKFIANFMNTYCSVEKSSITSSLFCRDLLKPPLKSLSKRLLLTAAYFFMFGLLS
jgi:hypothetical protein